MLRKNQTGLWLILTVLFIGVACIPCGLVIADMGDPSPDQSTAISELNGQVDVSGLLDPFLCPYPDLIISNLDYQSPANSGSEFTFTFTVTNTGSAVSEETDIQAVLPFHLPATINETVPPLQPGESIEVTITITIPMGVSIGNGFFSVILDPEFKNPECSHTNNEISKNLLVLPPGMTQEEYEKLTKGPYYKISEPINPAPPAPTDLPS